MAGLLDDLSGALGGSYSGDDTVKDQYGQTQADRRQPLWSGLIKAGLLGVAAGGNLMPADRAKYIAEAGGALGDIQPQMQAQQSNAMQNILRQQQVKTSQVEMQGKQADIAQKEKMRIYANSPEVQGMIAKLPPDRRAGAMGAVLDGNWEAFSKYLEPVKSTISQGWLIAPDGKTAFDTLTNSKMVLGPNGWEKVSGGTSTSGTPVDTDEVMRTAIPRDVWSQYGVTPRQQTSSQPPQWPPAGTENYPGMEKLPQPHQFDQAKFDALEPWLKPHVQDILAYNKPMPGFVRGGTQGLEKRQVDAINNAVSVVTNGTYRQPNFARIDQAVKDFDNPKGLGGTIDASNILVGHLQQFHDYAQALGNRDTQTINSIKNEWARKTGNPNISAYEMMEQAVGSEAMKSITNHATEGTLEGWKKPLSSFSSPGQMQAVVEGLIHAMQERDKQYTYDWNQRTLGTRPRATFLRPDIQRTIEGIKANPLGGKPAATAATNLPTITTQEQYNALPKGTRFIGGDGKQYERQ